MNLIKPSKLQKGDRVAAISLSAGVPFLFPDRFKTGCDQLSDAFDLEIIPTTNACRDPQWLAMNPQARADDLISALEDNSIKAVICSIGGEDSIRVNGLVPTATIRNNPKIFLGYSDATTTHFRFLQSGIVSFYGPTIMAGFGENGGLPSYLRKSIEQTLFQNTPIGPIHPNPDGWTTEFLDWAVPENQSIKRKLSAPVGPLKLQGQGTVSGHLMGGCVEVMEMLRGTEFWPDMKWFDGAILFLETAEKEFLPIHLARTLRSYGVMGILDKISALILGRPGGGMPTEHFKLYHDQLLSVIRDEFQIMHLPIIVNMDFGHTDPIFTIPYGLNAQLECDSGILNVLENGVS